tara:strand:+ start:194 stop:442 length:249 start_codon:yes stop_codon:yes gene_type:complete|mmetsp:Transcript_26108/g.67710  ORF Transcript_26108/g.67710 Transcript_26108/m.67710 type:complete len:83 (+) Transcript_26108:628-876(+)
MCFEESRRVRSGDYGVLSFKLARIIYARTDAQEYMETVLLALRQQFDNFQTTTAPDVGPPAHVEEVLETDGDENDDFDDDFS